MGKARRRAVAKGGPLNDATGRQSKGSDDGRKPKAGKPRWKGSNIYDELEAFGLRLHEVVGDGNCFFRVMADQLGALRTPEFQHEEDYCSLRKRVTAYMRANKDAFEPFVEDEEPWDEYMGRIERDGEWAGNLELQAASMELGVNIRVYQEGQPPWTVKNHPETAPLLHVSYHDGCHYNSVKPLGHTGAASTQEKNSHEENLVRRAKHATGCLDDSVIAAALAGVNWNLDAAIEELLKDPDGFHLGASADGVDKRLQAVENDEDGTSLVHVRLEVSGKKVRVQITIGDGLTEANDAAKSSSKSTKRSKRGGGGGPGRNTRCPCGSSTKYKNCCGAAGNKNVVATETEQNGVDCLLSLKTLYI